MQSAARGKNIPYATYARSLQCIAPQYDKLRRTFFVAGTAFRLATSVASIAVAAGHALRSPVAIAYASHALIVTCALSSVAPWLKLSSSYRHAHALIVTHLVSRIPLTPNALRQILSIDTAFVYVDVLLVIECGTSLASTPSAGRSPPRARRVHETPSNVDPIPPDTRFHRNPPLSPTPPLGVWSMRGGVYGVKRRPVLRESADAGVPPPAHKTVAVKTVAPEEGAGEVVPYSRCKPVLLVGAANFHRVYTWTSATYYALTVLHISLSAFSISRRPEDDISSSGGDISSSAPHISFVIGSVVNSLVAAILLAFQLDFVADANHKASIFCCQHLVAREGISLRMLSHLYDTPSICFRHPLANHRNVMSTLEP